MMKPRAGAWLTFKCPRCGHRVEDASVVYGGDTARPHAGDVSICLQCAAPLRLAAEGPPHWFTFEELRALPPMRRAEIVQVVLAVLTFRRRRRV